MLDFLKKEYRSRPEVLSIVWRANKEGLKANISQLARNGAKYALIGYVPLGWICSSICLDEQFYIQIDTLDPISLRVIEMEFKLLGFEVQHILSNEKGGSKSYPFIFLSGWSEDASNNITISEMG